MRVNLVYEVVNVDCELCLHEWVAIIETDEIDWGDNNKEVRLINDIECPECKNTTRIKR